MQSNYQGPERRRTSRDAGVADKLARVDERTELMLEMMKGLATVEQVRTVEKDLKQHVDSHVTKGNLVPLWLGTAAAVLMALVGLLEKKP